MGTVLSSGWTTFLIALVLSSPVIFWGFDRTEPVTVHNVDLFPTEVYPGQKVVRRISVTRSKSCQTEVDILIIDGARVRWVIDEPTVVSPGPLNIRDEYSQPVIIPVLASPGPAEMRIVTKRTCNPIHHIWPLVTHGPTLRFMILEPKAK